MTRRTRVAGVVLVICAVMLPAAYAADPAIVEIDGVGPEQGTAYYYTLNVGLGELKTTIEATFSEGAGEAFVSAELLDENLEVLAQARFDGAAARAQETIRAKFSSGLASALNAAIAALPSSKNATARVMLDSDRTLMLRVTVAPGVSQFLVRLSGTVAVQPGRAEIHAGVIASDQSVPGGTESFEVPLDAGADQEAFAEVADESVETPVVEEEPTEETSLEETLGAVVAEEVGEKLGEVIEQELQPAEEDADAPATAEAEPELESEPPATPGKSLVIPGRKKSVVKIPARPVRTTPVAASKPALVRVTPAPKPKLITIKPKTTTKAKTSPTKPVIKVTPKISSKAKKTAVVTPKPKAATKVVIRKKD
jgi:hypothetical protein